SYLSFELFDARNALGRYDVIHEGTHDAENHDGIGPGEAGGDEGSHRGGGNINFSGEKSLKDGRACGDAYNFGFYAMFLQQFLFLNHPDRAVGRTGSRPGNADSFLSEGYTFKSQERGAKNGQQRTSHLRNLLSKPKLALRLSTLKILLRPAVT